MSLNNIREVYPHPTSRDRNIVKGEMVVYNVLTYKLLLTICSNVQIEKP
jgi:hypothetical protein